MTSKLENIAIISFDIEAAQTNLQKELPFSVGACVMVNGKTVRKQFWTAYVPGVTVFDARTKEFWDKFPDILKKLEASTESRTKRRLLAEMTINFFKFMRDAEIEYTEKKMRVVRCSDNGSYDPLGINCLLTAFENEILDAVPDYRKQIDEMVGKIKGSKASDIQVHPLRYSFAFPDKYVELIDTSERMAGMIDLDSGGADVDDDWEYMKEGWEIPDKSEHMVHDHQPHNDAENDAFKLHVYFGIIYGVFPKRTKKRKRTLYEIATSK